VFAAFHGLEKEGFALPANFMIGGKRRFKIREQPARHGNDIPLFGQFQK